MLDKLARDRGFTLDKEMLGRFDVYERLLLEWNERLNLTAITDHEGIVVKHFLDCLLLLEALELPPGATLLDVGSGAGFPGVPLRIVRDDLRLTLLDSLSKRLRFLEELSDRLEQDNLLVHARAEDAGHDEALRETFDVVTARAVAALPVLCEYCVPFVRVGGVFAALKGPEVTEELHIAGRALELLGAEVDHVYRATLPGDVQRAIVVIRKTETTPPKYPRKPGQISKAPL